MTNEEKPFRLLGFMVSVMMNFKRNQGFLMAGAVSYYTLMSLVPMLIFILTVLSRLVSEDLLLSTMATYLKMVVPAYTATLLEHVRLFVQNRKMIGSIGLVGMLFFGSVAFTVLQNAMSVIFFHRVKRRGFLLSALIPFFFVFALALGIVVVSVVVGAMDIIASRHMVIFDRTVSLAGSGRVALQILGIAGELIMLTSIYLVMPVVRVTFRHALIGGMAATLLWEITRRILVWYYSNLSTVNIIYGSMATVVVTLISIEVSALILLLGAQVIAELGNKGLTAENTPAGFET